MSVVKYNSLIFEIRERLDELNVGRKLHFMCRGKVAPRSEENMQNLASSLIAELEEKEFLGPDNLDLLKDLLKDVKEWAFLEEVEKFESKRKEYFDLLEQIIRALDELNDLERLVSICRGKIPRERQGNICDVRSLFEELEINNCLGINRLGILKELLAQTGTDDLLLEVKEFDERRTQEDKFERRKARAAEIVSTARNNLTGVLTIKNVFKGVAGGLVIYSAFDLLRRHPTYDQLVNAINNCILPAGAKLIEMAEGSVNLKVHAENRLALDNLWRIYKNGTLKAGLQALLVTDEMIEFAGGEQVEVTVTIDEEEYIKAQGELTTESTDDPLGKEEKRLKYMGLEKYDYIQNYLEQAREQTKDIDSHSVMTETSDSGLLGSNSASSEVGTEEAGDSVYNPCLKDIRQEVTNELTSKLKIDPDILDRFYRSFGLDPIKLHTQELVDIKDIFPDTPVKVLKDVFKALQLYDFAELLEKATKPRALRPALSLKEIEKLPNTNNRPTKFFTKAEVLIIDNSDDADESPQNFGSFFKALNPQYQVIAVSTENCIELRKDLKRLRELNNSKCSSILDAKDREEGLKEVLESKGPVDHGRYMVGAEAIYRELRNQELLTMFEEKESAMKEELEKLIEEIERLEKESNKITKDLQKKNEELQAEYEKFNGAVSTHFNKWMEQAYVKGNESTLFVVVIANRLESGCYSQDFFKRAKIVNDCLKEKLPLIPQTKVVIISDPSRLMNPGKIPPETLQVYLPRRVGLGAVLELLNKRYKSLDLIAVILELKRSYLTAYGKGPYYHHYGGWFSPVDVTIDVSENLSCLPRLQKTEQL